MRFKTLIAGIFLGMTISTFGQTHNGIAYATTDANSHKLDIYMPAAGTAPYPVIVWIHGGAFKSGSRADGNASELASMFSGRGIAVISIDYRLSTLAKWPAQIHDCKAVIRWIRANAGTYKFNPDRIGVAGGSAGGHLAAMVGLTGNIKSYTIGDATMEIEGSIGGNTQFSSAVQAVLDMYGPTNFLTLNNTCAINTPNVSSQDHDADNSPESALIGGMIQKSPNLAKLASPISYVTPEAPPFLIQHGNRDPLIVSCQSVEFSTRLKEAFAANQKECSFHQFSSQSHGFSVTTGKDSVIAFFTRHLLSSAVSVQTQSEAATLHKPKVWISGSKIHYFGKEKFDLQSTDARGHAL